MLIVNEYHGSYLDNFLDNLDKLTKPAKRENIYDAVYQREADLLASAGSISTYISKRNI